MIPSLTHADLVNAAYKWVLNRAHCGVAFREFNTANTTGEIPDVIGFGSSGHSVLVECKTSRSDFFKDKNKRFRAIPSDGMGSQRFYCCPTGLLKVEDLPEGWGLLYVDAKGRATCVHKIYKGNTDVRKRALTKNMLAEHGLMYSALRRLHIRGRIDEIYDPKPQEGIPDDQTNGTGLHPGS